MTKAQMWGKKNINNKKVMAWTDTGRQADTWTHTHKWLESPIPRCVGDGLKIGYYHQPFDGCHVLVCADKSFYLFIYLF